MQKETTPTLPLKTFEEFMQLLHDKREYLPCICIGKVENISMDHLQDTILISTPVGGTALQLQIVLHSVAFNETNAGKKILIGQYIVFSYVQVYNQLHVHYFSSAMPEHISADKVENYMFSIEEENINMPEDSFDLIRWLLTPLRTIIANAMTARRGHKSLQQSKEVMPAQ